MLDRMQFLVPKGGLVEVVNNSIGRIWDRNQVVAYRVTDFEYLGECNDHPSRFWSMEEGMPGYDGCVWERVSVGSIGMYLGSTNVIAKGSSKIELYRIVLLGNQVYLLNSSTVTWCTPSEIDGSDEDGKRD